ncbi:S-methyl-5'-thioadenosine phosphorylase [bacterium]|nr:S-methyl-5'-thioadenosine phosphorylase [candidate division CSSED10-310 bacterium]
MDVKVAVIGGSGLYDIPGAKRVREISVSTPFGDPSDAITVLEFDGKPVAFLPRHGRGHRVNPTCVNARANIFALKTLGVKFIISVSAVGSLKEEIAPRDFVIPDQIIDRTKSRVNTFFDPYAVHVSFAEPFCHGLADVLEVSGRRLPVTVHRGGTYVCMEGPLFSTKAESAMHRSWGASIIGMTALPEAKLAREAEICYATVALVTDYDVWKDDAEVQISEVLANIKANTDHVKDLIRIAIPQLNMETDCACHSALNGAMITDPALIPAAIRKDWAPLIGKYIPDSRD